MAFENDPDGYRMAQMYAGKNFDKRRIKPIETFSEYSGAEWRLDEFREILDAAIDAIPPECRDSARVELEEVGHYESSVKLVVRYIGPEPQSEVDDRISRCEQYVRQSRSEERKQYERLKQKFGQ